MMMALEELSRNSLEDKKILLRVDYNVPVLRNGITDAYRITSSLATINYLLLHGAKIGIMSHITDVDTFSDIRYGIKDILGKDFVYSVHFGKVAAERLNEANIVLMDNLRRDPREMEDDEGFAKEISEGFDLYVNDAFGVSHRKHASVSAITSQLPAYGGLLLAREIESLKGVLQADAKGKVIVLGGAKVATKLPVIKNFIKKAEKVLIGGALANSFYKFKGIEIGKSFADDDVSQLADLDMKNLILPEDVVVSTDSTGQGPIKVIPEGAVAPEDLILDIGPSSAKRFADIIKQASIVIWNGPMGKVEMNPFAEGTRTVAEAVSEVTSSVIGGGDTIAAVDVLNMRDKFSYISTGGGAMLEYLAGNKLPALEALGYYDS